MPNTFIINCCLAIEAIDVLSPPLKPMSFPMALPRLLTQALPSWGPCSTQLSLCIQLPQLPSLLTLSYKHISAEWNPEKTLHSTESCRCVASLCYKTGHLSTVSREKSKYSHLITVLYQNQRKKITHKTQNRRVSNQRLTHAPSGVVLSLQEFLLLWVMPVDDGKQLWQESPSHSTAFTQSLHCGGMSRRKPPFPPSPSGTAQTARGCCDFSGWAGCITGELKCHLLPACDQPRKSASPLTSNTLEGLDAPFFPTPYRF